jgi:hypothetical protein
MRGQGGVLRPRHEVARRGEMPRAQLLHTRQRLFMTRRAGGRREAEQRIGDAAHCRDDHRRTAAVASARAAHDVDEASDSGRIGDRRAAEFLNDHD